MKLLQNMIFAITSFYLEYFLLSFFKKKIETAIKITLITWGALKLKNIKSSALKKLTIILFIE